MARPSDEVAILGATGYVGRFLCEGLLAAGARPVAICRPSRAFMLPSTDIGVLSPDEIGTCQPFQRIINLAYPTQGLEFFHPQQDREIARQVRLLAAPDATVIHTSTVAVFGFDLDQPIELALPSPRPDFQYVESKVTMEHLLSDGLSPDITLHIVRLGNVWGPGSPHWTVNLIQRLVEGEPIGVRGRDGFSNATDVANVAAYLHHLLGRDPTPGTHFHHLAEFSGQRWGRFVEFLEAQTGRSRVLVSHRPEEPVDLPAELKGLVQSLPFGAPIRQMFFTRRVASYVRRCIARSPSFVTSRLEAGFRKRSMDEQLPQVSPANAMTLRLLSCDTRFESALDPNWKAPVGLGESFSRVADWMRRCGFAE